MTTGCWAEEKSPPYALLSSLLIPGGGQFYCENTVKGIFFWLAQTFLLSAAILEHRRAEDYHLRYLQTQNPEDYNEYLNHAGRRADFIWIGGICYAISAADAYVSAHFYGFEGGTILQTGGGVRLVLFRLQF